MMMENLKNLIESEKLSKVKEKLKEKKNIGIQLIAGILIPFIIFFPLDLRNFTLILVVIVVVFFVVYVIITIKTGFIGLGGVGGIKYFLILMIFLIGLLLVTQFINCGGKPCFDVVGERFGATGAWLAFLGIFTFFVLLALLTSGATFWVTSLLTTILLIIFLPFLSPSSWYSTCKNIPFISSSKYCDPIRIKITPAKYISVQTSGGVNVEFNAPKSMYGGEAYEFSFSIKNLFPTSISFSAIPLLNIKYKTSSLYFTSQFQQGDSIIKPNTSYQSSALIDVNKLQTSDIPIIQSKYCPYTATDIARHKGYYTSSSSGTVFLTEKVECASDKPCQEKMCIASGSFECECLDLIDLTCASASKIYPGIYLKNSGKMVAKLTLYYSDSFTQAVSPLKFSNNDITLTLEAIPNPYIGSIHKYLEDVALFIKVKNIGGGEIKVKNINVYTPRTTINTTDLSKDVTLTEEIGTDIISCKSVSEVFPMVIEMGEEYGGMFCKLLPPQVQTKLIDHANNEVKSANVTYNVISSYCSGSVDEKWKDIFSTIEKSGFCEILKGRKEEERKIVNQSMSGAPVYVEVEYEKEKVYSSSVLDVNTRTRECIERCIEYCINKGTKEEECRKSCGV